MISKVTTVVSGRATKDDQLSAKELQMLKANFNVPDQVSQDELGRMIAPLELFEPFKGNPRNPEDFDVDTSAAFRELVQSIEELGVREPIQVFVKNGKLHMINGHRRRESVFHINQSRAIARQALADRGEKTDEPNIQSIDTLPISIVAEPKNEFDRRADMWTAEMLHRQWPVEKLVPFFRDTLIRAPDSIRDDTKFLAKRLGISVQRTRLLKAIVESDVLYSAAVPSTNHSLPVRGREKTLRSIIRCADVIFNDRRDAGIRITGMPQHDDASLELLRGAMVRKASEAYKFHDTPPGVYFERIAPRLRDSERISDDEIVAWATGPGMIAPELKPTTVRGVNNAAINIAGNPAKQMEGHLNAIAPDEMERAELEAEIAKLSKLANSLDERIMELKKVLRSRLP